MKRSLVLLLTGVIGLATFLVHRIDGAAERASVIFMADSLSFVPREAMNDDMLATTTAQTKFGADAASEAQNFLVTLLLRERKP